MQVRKNLKKEIERHERFNTMLGMKSEKVRLHGIDLKNYAKHTLNNGNPVAGVSRIRRSYASTTLPRLTFRHG